MHMIENLLSKKNMRSVALKNHSSSLRYCCYIGSCTSCCCWWWCCCCCCCEVMVGTWSARLPIPVSGGGSFSVVRFSQWIRQVNRFTVCFARLYFPPFLPPTPGNTKWQEERLPNHYPVLGSRESHHRSVVVAQSGRSFHFYLNGVWSCATPCSE